MGAERTAVIVGTGAGGAAMARKLQGKYQVTILEEGGAFRPFSYPLPPLAALRKTGLFFDERMISLLLPNMVIRKTKDMVLVRGKGLGGTTGLATGNAVRYDGALKKLGIRLDTEYEELESVLPITTDHRKNWGEASTRMYAVFEEMGLDPVVTPKLLDAGRCVRCGQCAIGCKTGAKWDTRAWIDEAVRNGAKLVSGCRAEKLEIENGTVKALHAKHGGATERFAADVFVLCAGGLGTPVILENSGIACSDSLFVDPVLCLAGPLPGIRQDRELRMPFISQQEGFILSPYLDYLSFFFDRRWRYPIGDIASVMVKLADEEKGSVRGKKVTKEMTAADSAGMEKAIGLCREILLRMGVAEESQFLGILNAGHPGGMLPLTEAEKDSLHSPLLPENLYVADATILPESMGNPPILTIMALAYRIGEILCR